MSLTQHRPGKRAAAGQALWLTAWWFTIISAPIRIVDDLVLGHPMPDWIAGLCGLAGGLVTIWLRPWLLRWLRGLSIWVSVCNRLMKGHR